MQMNRDEINLNGGLARPGKTTEVGMKLGAKKFPNKTKEMGISFDIIRLRLSPTPSYTIPCSFCEVHE